MSDHIHNESVDGEYDVVIMGGGGSGLSAALQAAKDGLRVAVLEKMDKTGGSAVYAEGHAAFESSEQKARGITVTKDQAFQRYIDYSHWRADPDVVNAQVNNAATTIDKLKELGIVYTSVSVYAYDQPNELPTFHRPDGLVAHVMDVLEKAVKEAGADIFLSTPVKEILLEDGRVTGVVAEDADHNAVRLACRAVIIASGGYSSNPDMIRKYSRFADVADRLIPTGSLGNTGDGFNFAMASGAAEFVMGTLMLIPLAQSKTLTSHVSGAGSQPGLWVNLTGQRFHNEGVAMNFADAGNVIAQQPDATVLAILDQDAITHLTNDGSDIGLGDFIPFHLKLTRLATELEQDAQAGEMVFKGATLEDLAHAAGIDADALVQTVDDYNSYCEKGHDDEYRKPAKFLRALRTGPYYAIHMAPGICTTVSGVKVNGDLQVIDTSGEPIPGLYAVGVDAGGLYGDSYVLDVPGTCNGFALTSGWLAADHVAATLHAESAALAGAK